jgi:phage-related minor tail protein
MKRIKKSLDVAQEVYDKVYDTYLIKGDGIKGQIDNITNAGRKIGNEKVDDLIDV